MEPYADSLAHVLSELERIDLLIRARVALLRRQQTQDEHFRGLYVSEEEVDALLNKPLGEPRWLGADEDWLAGADEALNRLGATIECRRAATAAKGIALALDRLQEAFGLDRLDIDVILIAAAVELDLRYEKIYAYLQDDVTRKTPSVELAIQLLARTPAERITCRTRFEPEAALLAHGLVHVDLDPTHPRAPLLARGIRANERIVRFLLSDMQPSKLPLDSKLLGVATLLDTTSAVLPQAACAGTSFGKAWTRLDPEDAAHAGAYPLRERDEEVLVLSGRSDVNVATQRSFARALCRWRGLALIEIDVSALVQATQFFASDTSGLRTEWPSWVARFETEALIRDAALFWSGLDDLESESSRSHRAPLIAAIDRGHGICIVSSGPASDLGAGFPRRGCVVSRVPEPSAELREATWGAALAGVPLAAGTDLLAVASRFRLPLEEIAAAANAAAGLAHQRDGLPAQVDQRDLLEACRRHSRQHLGSLARKIEQAHRWNDMVLPPERMSQLHDLCDHVSFRDLVHSEWGFGRKMSLGKGLAALFAGPSGTGKTMAAAIIANELGLDLYKIDLSNVISKYIGETEKNLARIFDEADRTDAILFFDEADALFGKRSEVRDSHDRYANIEVGFLLQRMEEYEGVAILATNMRKNMDDAFLRRLHFTVEFPAPDARHRLAIWQRIWPAKMPLDDTIDLEELASRYELSGGNIRNVAIASAFLAAADGPQSRTDKPRVRRGHILRAIHREFQKMGRLLAEDEILIDAV